jgi:hypothetical protein
MSVTTLQGVADGFPDFLWPRFPGSQPQGRYFCPSIQGEGFVCVLEISHDCKKYLEVNVMQVAWQPMR